MQVRLIWLLVFVSLVIVACQGPPPTQIVLVVTATPESPDVAQNLEASPTAESEATAEPTTEPTPEFTPTEDPFPTPSVGEIYVAEQRFENGRMFWLQPVNQIWVMTFDEDENPVWLVYDDTFEEGDPESDPDLEPPDEDLKQPIRGFGFLWRNNPEVKETLGWAIEDELGHSTPYEYHPGGTIVDGEFVPDAGYHVVQSLFGETFRFNEDEWNWEEVE